MRPRLTLGGALNAGGAAFEFAGGGTLGSVSCGADSVGCWAIEESFARFSDSSTGSSLALFNLESSSG